LLPKIAFRGQITSASTPSSEQQPQIAALYEAVPAICAGWAIGWAVEVVAAAAAAAESAGAAAMASPGAAATCGALKAPAGGQASAWAAAGSDTAHPDPILHKIC
jgi:hypothetical protein